jgi:hypothetical protein
VSLIFAVDEKQNLHSKYILYHYSHGSYFVAILALLSSPRKIYCPKKVSSPIYFKPK